jgi:hypothetical protein
MALAPASERDGLFEPGKAWTDTGGNRIQAHGGGMLFYKGVYYWFGENMDSPTDPQTQNVPLTGVSCYSSRDLHDWKSEGIVLAAVKDDPAQDLYRSYAVERPKVIYNRKTHKFVMWMHVDRLVGGHYIYARAGVAVADRPAGPYTYLGSVRPDGQESRDMTVFQDRDGSAYLIFATKLNSAVHISLLTSDYLKTSGQSAEIVHKGFCEGQAMFRSGDRYFLIVSACTGWRPNPALYAISQSVLGPWEVKGNPCVGPDAEVTFHSQSTYVLEAPGKRGAFIFMADRWNPSDLSDSRDVWLPLRVNSTTVVVRWFEQWDLSVFDKPW